MMIIRDEKMMSSDGDKNKSVNKTVSFCSPICGSGASGIISRALRMNGQLC